VLLTISTTHRPATDLGYLLHKNPARVQEMELAFGTARVFYPEASEERCTAALMLDVDPVGLTRRKSSDVALEQYVNDRPYVVSSFLTVAIARLFGTALSGRSKERQELADSEIPLVAEMPVVPVRRGGEGLIARLFEPLGYTVESAGLPLDPALGWEESPYYRIRLEARCRLRDLLRHLYLLIPVLDDRKHYWVGEDEIAKLLRRGEGWLADHPERELIVGRALKRQRPLTRLALDRLSEGEAAPDESRASRDEEEERLERPIRLHDERLDRIVTELEALGVRRVADLGCGSGKLLSRLLRSPCFDRIRGLDVSTRALEIAHRRLHLEDATPKLEERIELAHGSITYVDPRIEGFDAAVLVEVIEHLDAPRLAAAERAVFGHARPGAVLVTTPNREYNARFESLPAGTMRHPDHRFEWTREELRAWASGVAERFGYQVTFDGIGPEDPELGAPTQLARFERTP
jgi:3' terminal RNA ribose 2'-O-methyltransferase Hen1